MFKIKYDPQNDYYKRLGLESSASANEIQQAYRRLAKEFHPDLNPTRREWATAQFQRLNEAYDILSDPARKSSYDEQRAPFAWQAQGKNWWDQPHKAEPGYQGIYTPTFKKKTPLHPARQLLNELFIESPYRFVIVFLLLVFFATLGFIFMMLREDTPVAVSLEPTQVLLQIPAEGARLALLACGDYDLILQEIELQNGIAEIKAYHPALIYVDDAQLLWVKLEGDLLLYQGQVAKAQLRFGESAVAPILASQTLAQGYYVLRWITHNGRQCDQLLEVRG